MNFLFFDTETTGLPLNWRAPMTDTNNWPRVIQLAWLVAGDDGSLLVERDYLIKPNGWTIPSEKFWIDNGFNTETSVARGTDMDIVLDYFICDLQTCHCMVSHNMSFDYNVLGAELIRSKKTAGRRFKQFCTKDLGTALCKLPGNYGKYKWPKLSELHNHLFGYVFDNAHDALADVRACMNCFFEMMKIGVIEHS